MLRKKCRPSWNQLFSSSHGVIQLAISDQFWKLGNGGNAGIQFTSTDYNQFEGPTTHGQKVNIGNVYNICVDKHGYTFVSALDPGIYNGVSNHFNSGGPTRGVILFTSDPVTNSSTVNQEYELNNLALTIPGNKVTQDGVTIIENDIEVLKFESTQQVL